MAFAPTTALRLAAKKVERVDVSLAMRKWWGSFRPVNGLVSSFSPSQSLLSASPGGVHPIVFVLTPALGTIPT